MEIEAARFEIAAARDEFRRAVSEAREWTAVADDAWSPSQIAAHVIAAEAGYAAWIGSAFKFDVGASPIHAAGFGLGRYAPALVFGSAAEALAAFGQAVMFADAVVGRLRPEDLTRRVCARDVGWLLGVWPRHLHVHAGQTQSWGR